MHPTPIKYVIGSNKVTRMTVTIYIMIRYDSWLHAAIDEISAAILYMYSTIDYGLLDSCVLGGLRIVVQSYLVVILIFAPVSISIDV